MTVINAVILAGKSHLMSCPYHADYAAVQAQRGNLSRNKLTQLVREHSATVTAAH